MVIAEVIPMVPVSVVVVMAIVMVMVVVIIVAIMVIVAVPPLLRERKVFAMVGLLCE